MPESHKAEKRREQRNNIAAGIGDENGRIVRVKTAAIMIRCTICGSELKATKTNTELTQHADSKHSKPTEECVPGAAAAAAELIAIAGAKDARSAPTAGTSTPAASTKKKNDDLDSLLDAGLNAKSKGKK